MPDTPQQTELPLEAPPLPEDAPFLPARMVNEYVYCPRLAYLEWVQGEWAESADTVEGTHVHRRVDREDRPLPSAEVLADQDRPSTRSVTLSSRRLGLVAKIDMVESDGETVVPVDYKRGKRPHVAAGAYEPERVQICVQGLLLEENGYPQGQGRPSRRHRTAGGYLDRGREGVLRHARRLCRVRDQSAPRAPGRGDRRGEATRRLSRPPPTQDRHGSHQASAGHGPVADGHRPRAEDLTWNRVQGQSGPRVTRSAKCVFAPGTLSSTLRWDTAGSFA